MFGAGCDLSQPFQPGSEARARVRQLFEITLPVADAPTGHLTACVLAPSVTVALLRLGRSLWACSPSASAVASSLGKLICASRLGRAAPAALVRGSPEALLSPCLLAHPHMPDHDVRGSSPVRNLPWAQTLMTTPRSECPPHIELEPPEGVPPDKVGVVRLLQHGELSLRVALPTAGAGSRDRTDPASRVTTIRSANKAHSVRKRRFLATSAARVHR